MKIEKEFLIKTLHFELMVLIYIDDEMSTQQCRRSCEKGQRLVNAGL
jgi:hypothetical protein